MEDVGGGGEAFPCPCAWKELGWQQADARTLDVRVVTTRVLAPAVWPEMLAREI